MIPVNMPIKDIRASVAVTVTYVSHDTSGPMFEMLQIILNETPKHSRFTTIANVILIINFWDLTDLFFSFFLFFFFFFFLKWIVMETD